MTNPQMQPTPKPPPKGAAGSGPPPLTVELDFPSAPSVTYSKSSITATRSTSPTVTLRAP